MLTERLEQFTGGLDRGRSEVVQPFTGLTSIEGSVAANATDFIVEFTQTAENRRQFSLQPNFFRDWRRTGVDGLEVWHV